jgi:hypothetical protein
MRLACRLINGDGMGFEYAIVELTPEYVSHLLRLVEEAKRFKESHDEFYAVELFDVSVEYGFLDETNDETDELIDSDCGWVTAPDAVQLNRESTSTETVVVTSDSVYWKAAAKHSDTPTYYETATLTVAELRDLFSTNE